MNLRSNDVATGSPAVVLFQTALKVVCIIGLAYFHSPINFID